MNLSLLEKIQNFLEESKFEEISVIDLENKTEIADKMMIATGRSERHIISYARKLTELIKKNSDIIPVIEGVEKADWVLVDTGQYLIHLFKKEVRERYKLEQLWEMRKSK